MPDTLLDGTGTRSAQKVDAKNRAHTFSITVSAANQANIDGDAYNLNTGTITLTDAVDTPVLYLKNTHDSKIINVSAIAIGIGPSTNAVLTNTPLAIVTVVRNPTAGTIISGATNAAINSNRNYGSANTLTADVYKGATGNTMTNGDDHLYLFQTGPGRLFATIDEVLPPGSSMGIKIDPAPSNTDMMIYAAIIMHVEDQ